MIKDSYLISFPTNGLFTYTVEKESWIFLNQLWHFTRKKKFKTSSWQANLVVRLEVEVADGAGMMNVAHIRTHYHPLEVGHS